MNRSPERRWGIISTIVMHTLLFLIFMAVHVQPSPQQEDFVELTFSSIASVKSDRYSPPPPPPKTSPPANTERGKPSRPQEVVKLPRRKMVENEPPVLEPPPRERVYMDKDPVRLSDQKLPSPEPAREESKVDLRERYIGKREDTPNPITAAGTRPGPQPPTQEVGEGLSPAQSYSIEWTGGTREKLWGELPAYPPGLNKSAIIRVRLFVLPDGTVGQMILLQKGDATLESVTVQALKTWRFSKLEPNYPQIPQQGIVAFIFRVE